MNALAYELERRGLPALPRSNVNWQVVALGVNFVNRVAKRHPQRFAELNESQKAAGLAPLAAAVKRQESYVHALRGFTKDGLPRTIEEHPLLSVLCTRYLEQLRSLLPLRGAGESDDSFVPKLGIHRMSVRAARDIVAELDAHGTYSIPLLENGKFVSMNFAPVAGPPTLWSSVTGTTFNMYWGGNRPYWDGLGNLAKVQIAAPEGPVGSNSYPQFPSVELISLTRLKPRNLLLLPGNEFSDLTFTIKFYDVLLDTRGMSGLRLMFQGPRRLQDMNPTPTDPIDYIVMADGKKDQTAGSEAIGRDVSADIARLYENLRNIQVQRVHWNRRLHWGYIAGNLCQAGSKEYAFYAEPLREMGALAVVIRAVLRLGYPDQYATMDPVSALFDGGLQSALVDERFLQHWAMAVSKTVVPEIWPPGAQGSGKLSADIEMALDTADRSKPPSQCLRSLEDIAFERYGWMVTALNTVLEAAALAGDSRPLQSAVLGRSFALTHEAAWDDASPL